MTQQTPAEPSITEEEEEEEYSEEFDELKEQQDRHMPIIYSTADEETQLQYAKQLGIKIKPRPTIVNLVKTKEFKIVDMHFKDSTNTSIIGSWAIYYIEPHKQILPWNNESIPGIKVKKNLWYEILAGKGLLCIDNYTESIIQRDMLLIEQDVTHNFFNTGDTHLIIKMMYDGLLDLRDRYTPTQKISQEAKESKEKFFNASTQQEEEKVRKVIEPPRVPKVKRYQVTNQTVSTTTTTTSNDKFL